MDLSGKQLHAEGFPELVPAPNGHSSQVRAQARSRQLPRHLGHPARPLGTRQQAAGAAGTRTRVPADCGPHSHPVSGSQLRAPRRGAEAKPRPSDARPAPLRGPPTHGSAPQSPPASVSEPRPSLATPSKHFPPAYGSAPSRGHAHPRTHPAGPSRQREPRPSGASPAPPA